MNFLIYFMSEAPQSSPFRLSHSVAMSFYNAIKEIPRLYWHSFSIQEEIDEENKVFSCTIRITEPLSAAHEEEIQVAILSLIQKIILPALPQGFKSTLWDITFVIQGNSQSETSDPSSEGYMWTVCGQVEQEFQREEIRVEYQSGGEKVLFIVYGAAPRDHVRIQAAIIARIPHTLQCPMSSIQFQSHSAAKRAQEVPAARNTQQWVRALLANIFNI